MRLHSAILLFGTAFFHLLTCSRSVRIDPGKYYSAKEINSNQLLAAVFSRKPIMAVTEEQMERTSHDNVVQNSGEPTASPITDLDGSRDFLTPSPIPNETMEAKMMTPPAFPSNDRGSGSEEVPVLYPSHVEEGTHLLPNDTPMPSSEEGIIGEMYASPMPSNMPPLAAETSEPSSFFNDDARFIRRTIRSKENTFHFYATLDKRAMPSSANFVKARYPTKLSMKGRTRESTMEGHARGSKKSAFSRGPIMRQSRKEGNSEGLGPQPSSKWLDNGTKKVREVIWKVGPALLP